MKKLFFIAAVFCFTIQGNAQNEPELIGTIELEGFFSTRLMYVDHGIPKLIYQNQEDVQVYNMDFTLNSMMELPSEVTGATNQYNVNYVSKQLFDCDTTQLEYIIWGFVGDSSFTSIYREDGTLYHSFEGLTWTANSSFGSTDDNVVIASDENGSYTYMSGADGVSLFRFCGQLPQPMARESNGALITGIMEQENNNGFDLYPNPAREIIKFEYDLQGHKKANLQLFNTSGQLMKEMMLGQAFDFIQLNISDLEQGTYIARITSDDGFELSEKFVKVD